MYNNPAFQMFLMATLECYWPRAPRGQQGWATGVNKLLIISVGTGTSPAVRQGLNPDDMNLLFNATTIPSALMFLRSRHSPPAPPVPAARRATVARQSPSCAEQKNAWGHSHRRPKRPLRQLWRSPLRACARHHSSCVTLRLRFNLLPQPGVSIIRAAPQLVAARDTAATLRRAGAAYFEAFRAAPACYYPDINALTLGRLWEHVTGRQSRLDLAMISAGVGWATDCALAHNKDFWALATRAERALVENDAAAAIEDYGEAGPVLGQDS
jgi:hypothetical protein